MQQLLLMFHILLCISLIALVLLQHGKGADIGAAFGAGASQTVFGSQGSTSFLTKLTASLAALFFVTSLFLTYLTTQDYKAQKGLIVPKSSITQPVAPNASKQNPEQKNALPQQAPAKN
ncbi:MAG: preprotein translocase subunit SecG [Pseudomonadota bacterium]